MFIKIFYLSDNPETCLQTTRFMQLKFVSNVLLFPKNKHCINTLKDQGYDSKSLQNSTNNINESFESGKQ